MLEKSELTNILITVICTKMLSTAPRTVILNSGNAAWLQIIYNSIVVLLLFFITMSLYKHKKNIIQLVDNKLLRIIVGIIVIVTLFINFLTIIRMFPENVKIVLLKEMDMSAIGIIFLITASLGAFIGIEAIARVNRILLPIVAILMLLFIILLIPNYHLQNIYPIFGEGVDAILGPGFNSISLFSDILLFNILLPHSKNLKAAKSSGYTALIISIIFIVAMTLSYCLTYSYPASKDFLMPVYQMSRVIHISSFFSRFEAFFQFVWSIIILLYTSIYIYAICYTFQITFNLRYYKPLIFPVALIAFEISLLPASIVNVINNEKIINILVYPTAFLLPIIFGAISLRRKKHETA